MCCRLRSVDAHDQQKGFEFRWIGNCDDTEKSDDGYNSQWWCADAWRGTFVKELDVFLTMKVLEDTPAVLSLGKLCDEHGYSYEWINCQKPHLIKNRFRKSVRRKTSYQSWFLVYQRVLPQACLPQHPWHLQAGNWSSLVFLKLVYLNTHDIFNGDRSFRSPSSNRVKRNCGYKNGQTRMGRITILQSCQVQVWKGKNGETRTLLKLQKSCWINQPKLQNQIKIRITSRYGETLTFRHTWMAARIQRESCG